MAFITGQTNRRLGRKPPSEYLGDIVDKQGEAALSTQLVPTDYNSLTVANYRQFLADRRVALATCMNGFIDKKAGGG